MTKEEIISYTELSMRSIELDNDKDTVAYDFYKSVLKILQIDPCKTCQKVKTTFKQTANEYEVTCEPITEPCEDIWKFALHCMELGYGVDILKQYTASEAMAKLEKFKKLESIAPCGDAISRKHLLLEIDDLMKSPWFNRYKDDCGALHFGYIERKEAVEIVRDLCVKTEPLVQPKASCSEKPNDCEGCISRQAAIKETLKYTMTSGVTNQGVWNECVQAIADTLANAECLPSVQPKAKSEWIPIKTRPLTEEEKKEMDTESDYMYNCLLPDDGEEVEVTTYLGDVTLDVFCRDSSGGCYFEHYCDDGDVLAWRHKPEPYKAESEVTE